MNHNKPSGLPNPQGSPTSTNHLFSLDLLISHLDYLHFSTKLQFPQRNSWLSSNKSQTNQDSYSNTVFGHLGGHSRRMNMSRPAVHPVEAPPLSIDNGGGNAAPPRARMKDFPGMPGTTGGLVLRLVQSFFAVGALLIMSTTSDFPSVTAFRYLVAASGLQIIWSLSLAVLDVYAMLVKRSFRSCRAVSLFAAGDGITSTLIFAAACASAGITVLIGNDLNSCAKNHCVQFETSTGMAFMTWFAALPSFLLNFWSLASR